MFRIDTQIALAGGDSRNVNLDGGPLPLGSTPSWIAGGVTPTTISVATNWTELTAMVGTKTDGVAIQNVVSDALGNPQPTSSAAYTPLASSTWGQLAQEFITAPCLPFWEGCFYDFNVWTTNKAHPEAPIHASQCRQAWYWSVTRTVALEPLPILLAG